MAGKSPYCVCFGAILAMMAVPLDAAQFLVVTRDSAGNWSLKEADEILINGKNKVRTVTISTTPTDSWDAKSIGRLPGETLERLELIVRAGDGRLYTRPADGSGWTLLLPDGGNAKSALAAAEIWRGATISLKQDRKEKVATPIQSPQLYAIVPGQDSAEAAARMATEASIHQFPGIAAGEAFRHMLELVPAVVKAYPSGKGADEVGESLRSGLSTRLTQWFDGDAPVTVLEECLLLSKASEAAFPANALQAALRKQAAEARKSLDRKVAILRALHAGKQADAFLTAYREFEPYDKSFPDLAAARRAHLTESAQAHVETARLLRKEGDFASAIRHLRLAQLRSPDLKEAGELLEEVRLEIARLSAQKFAENRRGIDPRSPAQVQLQRRLLLAEQYAGDGKQQEAEQALHEAEGIDKDEPRIKLAEARLASDRGDLGLALALLDLYAGVAVTQQDFAEGERLRASVQYKIENSRKEERSQLTGLYSEQRFAAALQSAATGLKLDNEEPDFLFQAGVNACLLRHCPDAGGLLHRFLDLTDSTEGVRARRLTALRLLRQPAADPPPPPQRGTAASWFSGAALDAGVFYDPASLAFQPKITHITASDHLTVLYDWSGNQLRSVHTRYEEKKTGSNIAKVALAAVSASQGLSLPVSWRTTGRETNDFYFSYYDDAPQIFNVGRDNKIVKSEKIPIRIPSFGGFGGFGIFGSLAGLGGTLGVGALQGLGGLGGMRGVSGLSLPAGFAPAGNLRGLPSPLSAISGLSASRGLTGMPGFGTGSVATSGGFGLSPLTALQQMHPSQNYSIHNDPQGGSTSGYLTLWNNPRLDTRLAYIVTGKRVAVGFSGNHYFHPFAWDAIHLFELDYDAQGRVSHAWELDEPNAPRLDFAWDGKRLLSIVGRTTGASETVVYSRTLNYSGDKLTGEAITQAGKTSHIQYKYNKQGVLIEAECDADPSIDGRSRRVEFLDETSDKGKH
jgi:tetratricopeptide (TPR) repeat protein